MSVSPTLIEEDAMTASDQTEAIYFVDFDHTLLRSNSTQEFLRTARPFALIWPILQMVSLAMKLLRIDLKTRFVWEDAIKVRLLRLLNPWVMSSFRKIAPEIASAQLNAEVVSQLEDVSDDRIVIVSFGFKPVIEALLAQTRFANCAIIAPSFGSGPTARRLGKVRMLADNGVNIESNSVLLTDNLEDDADLAEQTGSVVPIDPDLASVTYRQPYLPFFYTAKIKRTPGFLIKQVFLEELPIVLLAFGLIVPAFALSTWLSLTFLFLAMILTYELGYAENDRVGEQTESQPKLSQNYFKQKAYKLLPHAWVYAGVLTLVGVLCLGSNGQEDALARLGLEPGGSLAINTAILSSLWFAVLIAARFIFYCFNKAPLIWRVYIYAPLHIAKYIGFATLFAISAAGLIFIFAHIVRTWSLYAVRRAGGDVDYLLSQGVRLLFLLFGFGILAFIDPSLLLTWQSLFIIVFCVVRAVPELIKKT